MSSYKVTIRESNESSIVNEQQLSKIKKLNTTFVKSTGSRKSLITVEVIR